MRAREGFPSVVSVIAVLALLPGAADRAAAGVIVVPNAETAFSDNTGTGGGSHNRSQEVFSASQFPGLGPILITQIAYRPYPTTGMAFGPTTDHGVRFDLSTTSAAPGTLSSTFANNVGADDTVVFNGDWTRSKAFDITLTLATPFVYDPSKGNLLLDVLNPSGDLLYPTTVDAVLGAASGVDTLNGASTSPTGIRANFGVVVQFTFSPAAPPAVPEPSSLALFALGGVILAVARWKPRGARA
jgi:hypothetical protein